MVPGQILYLHTQDTALRDLYHRSKSPFYIEALASAPVPRVIGPVLELPSPLWATSQGSNGWFQKPSTTFLVLRI